MESFLEDNWIALISLLVALAGGIPGLVAVREHLRQAPRFGVDPINYFTGDIGGGSQPMLSYLLLTLTVWNRGDRPLTPKSFNLRIKLNGRSVAMDRFLIPPNTKFLSKSGRQTINVGNAAELDLQRFNGSITVDEPLRGLLMFTTPELTSEDMERSTLIKVQFTCVDIFGKKHSSKFKLEGEVLTGDVAYPKHGVVVESTSEGDELDDA